MNYTEKFLCLKNRGTAEAGSTYRYYNGVCPELVDSEKTTWMNDFIKVKTFEQDGKEWIDHTSNECPVPRDWLVEIQLRDGQKFWPQARYVNWLFSNIQNPFDVLSYRVLSTMEQDHGTKTEQDSPEEEVTARDLRPMSSVELAYAAKVKPVPVVEHEKTIPLSCLDDIEFPGQLGLNQFVRDGA